MCDTTAVKRESGHLDVHGVISNPWLYEYGRPNNVSRICDSKWQKNNTGQLEDNRNSEDSNTSIK